MAETICRKTTAIFSNELFQLMDIGVSDALKGGAASSPLIRMEEKSNSIRIKSDTFNFLKEKKIILKEEWGKCTYDMAIRSLLMELEEVKKVNEQLTEESQSHADDIKYYKTLVLNLSENQEIKQEKTKKSKLSLPPPPPSFTKKSPKKETEKDKKPLVETKNVRQDHKKELLLIFNGGNVSPSEVLKRANPLHSQSELVEVTHIPNINDISTAKKYGKRKITW